VNAEPTAGLVVYRRPPNPAKRALRSELKTLLESLDNAVAPEDTAIAAKIRDVRKTLRRLPRFAPSA
jgi:protein-arginine kinase activator protein McsA